MDEIIKLMNVNLNYPIYSMNRSLRSIMLNKKKNQINFIHALKDINLNIKKGDRIGLLGKNGSGKTTLLKTIGGIFSPTTGSVNVKYETFSLFDINMGLNLDATGIENIYILGYLRGFNKNQITKRLDAIIEFSELNKFINLPINTYSSGMRIRLASAIALEIVPKILLIDEFFGAGDSDFKEKSRIALKEKINEIEVLIFASHDYALIKSTCNRIITLENGSIIKDEINLTYQE